MSIKSAFLFTILIMLVTCRKEEPVRQVVEKYPDGKEKKVEYISPKSNEVIKIETFYPNGQIQLSQEMKNGKAHGKSVYYYPNGQIWSSGTFKDGLPHGERITYYQNGKVRYEGQYIEGKKAGKWTFYDENGRKIKEVRFS
ncbi:MAG: hypothetical protein N2Z72_07620 [Bacteroidales bacterium]|nr:hypothetical protein [Bacteroidales bacterium]